MKKIVIALVLTSVLLLSGCVNVDIPDDVADQIANDMADQGSGGIIPSVGKIEVTPVIVEGVIGKELSDGHVKLKVKSYELRQLETFDKGFFVFDIEIENLSDQDIDIYNNFKLITSLNDKTGRYCFKEAIEKNDQALPRILKAKEKKTGLLLCQVSGSYGKEFSNIFLLFDDEIPSTQKNKYTSDSKFGEIKVTIFKFADINDSLVAEGKTGEWIDGKLGWNAIKVNNWKTESKIGTVDAYELISPSSVDGWTWCYYAFGGVSRKHEGSCELLIVNLTVKNKAGLFEEDNSANIFRYVVKLNNVGLSEEESVIGVYEQAFEQLENPLNLDDMAPGEERTGDLVYVIPTINLMKQGYGEDITENFTVEYSFAGTNLKSKLD